MRDRALASAAAIVAAGALGAAGAGAGQARIAHVSVYAPRGAVGPSCSRVLPLPRAVRPPAVLSGAMQALVRGPTRAERARGYGGWFSAKTAGTFRSARIANGVAFVDFGNFSRRIPNASSSCGSALLLAQLDRTAKQFSAVRRTVYSFEGSPRAFYEWLQRSPPSA